MLPTIPMLIRTHLETTFTSGYELAENQDNLFTGLSLLTQAAVAMPVAAAAMSRGMPLAACPLFHLIHREPKPAPHAVA